jgi:hypothetical protein
LDVAIKSPSIVIVSEGLVQMMSAELTVSMLMWVTAKSLAVQFRLVPAWSSRHIWG